MDVVRGGLSKGEGFAYMDLLSVLRRSGPLISDAARRVPAMVGLLCGALVSEKSEIRDLSSQALALLIEAAGDDLWEAAPIRRSELVANLLRPESSQLVTTPSIRVLIALFLSMRELPMEHLYGFIVLWNASLVHSKVVTESGLGDLQQPFVKMLQFAIERLNEIRSLLSKNPLGNSSLYIELQRLHVVPLVRNMVRTDLFQYVMKLPLVLKQLLQLAKVISIITIEFPSETSSSFVKKLNSELIDLLKRLQDVIDAPTEPLERWRHLSDNVHYLPAICMNGEPEVAYTAQSLLFLSISSSTSTREKLTMIALEAHLGVITELNPARHKVKTDSPVIGFTDVLLSYTKESRGPVATKRDEIVTALETLNSQSSEWLTNNTQKQTGSLVQRSLHGYFSENLSRNLQTGQVSKWTTAKHTSKRPLKISYDSRTHKVPRMEVTTRESDGEEPPAHVDDTEPPPLEEDEGIRSMQSRPHAPAPKPFSITTLLGASNPIESPSLVPLSEGPAPTLKYDRKVETILAEAYESRISTLTPADFEIPLHPLYAHVLGIKIHDVNKGDSSNPSDKEPLEPVLLRFCDGEQYTSTFTPLLQRELRAALSSELGTLLNGKAELKIQRLSCVQSTVQSPEHSLSESILTTDTMSNSTVSKKSLGIFQREDLVVITSGHASKISKVTCCKKWSSNLFWLGASLSEILTTSYCLGIVVTPIRKNNKKEKSEAEMTIFNVTGTVEVGQDYCLVALTSLSTFIREWTAVQSIHSAELMPLAPYLLKAAPVISIANMRYNEYFVTSLLPEPCPTANCLLP